jgi:hypothetical protein
MRCGMLFIFLYVILIEQNQQIELLIGLFLLDTGAHRIYIFSEQLSLEVVLALAASNNILRARWH